MRTTHASSSSSPLCSQVCKAPFTDSNSICSPSLGYPTPVAHPLEHRKTHPSSHTTPSPPPTTKTSASGILRGPSPSTHQLQHALNLFQELFPSKLLTYARRGVPSLPLQMQHARSSLQSSTFTNTDCARAEPDRDPRRTLHTRSSRARDPPPRSPGQTRVAGPGWDPKGARGGSTWLRARLRVRPGPRGGRAPVPARAAALRLSATGALAQQLRGGLAVVAGPTAGPARAPGTAATAARARRA